MSRKVIWIQPKKINESSTTDQGQEAGSSATGGGAPVPKPRTSLGAKPPGGTVRIGSSSSYPDLRRCASPDGTAVTRIKDHGRTSRESTLTGRSSELDPSEEEPVKLYNSKSAPHKFHLMILLLPDVEEKFPQCKFTPNMGDFSVQIKGSGSSDAYRYMLQRSMKMASFPLMPKDMPLDIVSRMMHNRKYKGDLCEKMRKLKVHLYKSGEEMTWHIIVASHDKEEEVRGEMDRLFSYRKWELSKDEMFLLRSEYVRQQVNSLEDKYKVCRKMEDMLMEVEGLEDNVDLFMEELEALMRDRDQEVHKELIQVEQPKWEFIKRFCKPELEDCLSLAGGRVVKAVDSLKSGGKCQVEISGPEDSVKRAVEKLKQTIFPSVQTSTLELHGKSMLLKISSFSTIEINRMQAEESCIIETQIRQSAQPATSTHMQDMSIAAKEEAIKEIETPVEGRGEDEARASNLTFEVGNIGKFRADVLVCPVSMKKGQLNEMGAIPKSLLGYDSNLQKKYDKEVPSGGLREGELRLVESSGNLAESCQYVIFLAMDRWRAEGSEKPLQKMIYSCLDEANKRKATSIAFPTIGCGPYLKFPVYRVAYCFKLCADKTLLKNMKITVVSYDEKTKKKFEEARYSKHKSSRPRPKSEWGAMPVKFSGASDAVFNIFAKTTAQIDKVKAEIKKAADNLISFEEVDLVSYSDNLTEKDWGKIHEMEADNLVLNIDKVKGKICILGDRSAVENSASEIKRILEKSLPSVADDSPQSLKRLAKMEFAFPQEWSDSTKSDSFFGFELTKVSDQERKDIEGAVMATINTVSYHIGRGHDAQGLGGYSTYEITNVKRVENPHLYKSYWELRKNFLRNAASKAITPVAKLKTEADVILFEQNNSTLNDSLLPGINEYYLLHGTKSAIIGSIMTEGLDFRLGEEGGLFGKGIYLAESMSKADQYADDRNKRSPVGEEMTMFVMRVVLGNVCLLDKVDGKGYIKYKTPPCVECHEEGCRKHNAICNSVLGVTNGKMRMLFREFVIYERAQCYPEYLITYKRK